MFLQPSQAIMLFFFKDHKIQYITIQYIFANTVDKAHSGNILLNVKCYLFDFKLNCIKLAAVQSVPSWHEGHHVWSLLVLPASAS